MKYSRLCFLAFLGLAASLQTAGAFELFPGWGVANSHMGYEEYRILELNTFNGQTTPGIEYRHLAKTFNSSADLNLPVIRALDYFTLGLRFGFNIVGGGDRIPTALEYATDPGGSVRPEPVGPQNPDEVGAFAVPLFVTFNYGATTNGEFEHPFGLTLGLGKTFTYPSQFEEWIEFPTAYFELNWSPLRDEQEAWFVSLRYAKSLGSYKFNERLSVSSQQLSIGLGFTTY